MKIRDAVDLLLLAALWGASFLFMRVAAPEFGPIALIELRVAIAALVLLPILKLQTGTLNFKGKIGALFVIGLTNSAIPFCLMAYATLFVTAGFASILNATSPLWAGLVTYIWFQERLSRSQILGLLLGFVGVAILVGGKGSLSLSTNGWAIIAALVGTFSYALAASYTKRYLTGISPLVVSTGSQVAAALILFPLSLATWPQHVISRHAWLAVIALGIACTAIAYLLYFRLIARVGPSKAISVTFLIPIFAVVWGKLFLGETVTLTMLMGGLVILIGTALGAGLIKKTVA